jgi:ligand-binding sensor domain-containing protein
MNGKPLAAVVLEALRLSEAGPPQVRQTVYTDNEERFQLHNLKPGAWLLRCHRAEAHVYYSSAPSGGPDTLQVEPGTSRSDLDFKLAPFKKGRWKNYGTFGGFTDRIRQIYQRGDGLLWLATADGVWHFDGERCGRVGVEQGLAHANVFGLYEDASGVLWFSTSRGISRYDGVNFLPFDGGALVHHRVEDLHQDHSGDLWFGTWRGVSRYDGERFSHVFFKPTAPIWKGLYRDIFEDRSGALWFATQTGVLRDNGGYLTLSAPTDGLPLNQVNHIYQTADDLIWFATDNGLLAYDPYELTVFSKADGLSGPYVSALFPEADGQVWVGTRTNGGVTRVKGMQVGIPPKPLAELRAFVADMQRGADGALWIATDQAVWHYTEGTPDPERMAPNVGQVADIYQDREGTLWFAGSRGIAYLEEERFVPFAMPSNGQAFRSILQDRRGALWFNGAALYRAEGGAGVETVRLREYPTFLSVYVAPDGALWLGAAKGLLRLDGETRSVLGEFSSTAEVPLVNISTIAGYGDKLYFGGVGRLAIYDGQTWAVLDRRDGLPGGSINALAFDTPPRARCGSAATN